jgi:hypothetical protein
LGVVHDGDIDEVFFEEVEGNGAAVTGEDQVGGGTGGTWGIGGDPVFGAGEPIEAEVTFAIGDAMGGEEGFSIKDGEGLDLGASFWSVGGCDVDFKDTAAFGDVYGQGRGMELEVPGAEALAWDAAEHDEAEDAGEQRPREAESSKHARQVRASPAKPSLRIWGRHLAWTRNAACTSPVGSKR